MTTLYFKIKLFVLCTLTIKIFTENIIYNRTKSSFRKKNVLSTV